MSIKTIAFVMLGLFVSTFGTMLLMKGDVQRMREARIAKETADCQQQAAQRAAAPAPAATDDFGAPIVGADAAAEPLTTDVTGRERPCPTTPDSAAAGTPVAADATVANDASMPPAVDPATGAPVDPGYTQAPADGGQLTTSGF